jgi:hypothetical protein
VTRVARDARLTAEAQMMRRLLNVISVEGRPPITRVAERRLSVRWRHLNRRYATQVIIRLALQAINDLPKLNRPYGTGEAAAITAANEFFAQMIGFTRNSRLLR